MDQKEQIRLKTTHEGRSLADRLALMRQNPRYKQIPQGSLMMMRKHADRIAGLGNKLPDTEVGRGITWLNTQDDQPWSF